MSSSEDQGVVLEEFNRAYKKLKRTIEADLSTLHSNDVKENLQKLTPPKWRNHIKEVLYTAGEIQHRVKQLAEEISQSYSDVEEEIVVVGLLSGAVPFMTDLLRYLAIPYTCDYMDLSSYGDGTESSGVVKMKKDLNDSPSGKHILIVEDIIDSGNTMHWLKNFLATKNCKSVKVVTLLSKQARRVRKNIDIDFVGYDCADEFVVGYGMDYKQRYRGLPYIGVLKEEVYN
jgi:hypoxanthine phosphoribosyltransferase